LLIARKEKRIVKLPRAASKRADKKLFWWRVSVSSAKEHFNGKEQ